MRGLSFTADGELFVVDITLVQKVARKMAVTLIHTAPDEVIGIANMKGSVITLLSLYVLLGRKERRGQERFAQVVNAVIFKSPSGSEDQMGLVIDEPGGLININEEAICPPSLATGAEESFCISGIADIGNKLYRIICIDSIIKKYKQSSEINK